MFIFFVNALLWLIIPPIFIMWGISFNVSPVLMYLMPFIMFALVLFFLLLAKTRKGIDSIALVFSLIGLSSIFVYLTYTEGEAIQYQAQRCRVGAMDSTCRAIVPFYWAMHTNKKYEFKIPRKTLGDIAIAGKNILPNRFDTYKSFGVCLGRGLWMPALDENGTPIYLMTTPISGFDEVKTSGSDCQLR